MAKAKTIFYCQACGYEAPQWLGKCPQCNEWNTFDEIKLQGSTRTQETRRSITQQTREVKPLHAITFPTEKRFSVGSSEFDRVLGGGVFPHTTLLVVGEPGIGKSTLLLQTAANVASQRDQTVLYISAEESLSQVKERFVRLGLTAEKLFVVAESDLAAIEAYIAELEPVMVIIDSVQAIYDSSLSSPPGTILQVRETAHRLCRSAKDNGCILFLIGHVTKDGVLAGPRSLEHLVDTVVYFEGDRYHSLRMVRSIKNRFGATGEIGIFNITETGLSEVVNPSEIFLPPSEEMTPGRVPTAVIEGCRPFLVEIQALTNKTSFNMPLRRAVGIEVNKISLLIAVIERSLALPLTTVDVFLKAVGGLKLHDAACDLAIVCAIISTCKDIIFPADTVCIGEVGLSGEIRRVRSLEARIKEAARLGFKHIIIPKQPVGAKIANTTKLTTVNTLSDVYSLFFRRNN